MTSDKEITESIKSPPLERGDVRGGGIGFIHPHLYPPPRRERIGPPRGLFRAAVLALVIVAISAPKALADGWDSPNPWGYDWSTTAPNTGSVANTRHNMTVEYNSGGMEPGGWVNHTHNRYGEVCVYCHTPHGASNTVDAPLWNRTDKGNAYTLYNLPLTSGQTPTQPGVNSLTCLSCHDGVTAIDSIINMPGSGRYNAAQETSVNYAFLDTWPNAQGGHYALTVPGPGYSGDGCLDCHGVGFATNFFTNRMSPDFRLFVIGTDLTDDHPVGVKLPDTNTYDFKAPTGTDGALQFFDTNGDGRADNNEVRFYDTGEGYEVECASCHDPHGVESAGPGSEFIPSFLRVNNNNASSLCLTCHDK
ncbi:MAG: cytochrome c3 family protein [Candidatus Nitrospinota bacterium M3_3B_026]